MWVAIYIPSQGRNKPIVPHPNVASIGSTATSRTLVISSKALCCTPLVAKKHGYCFALWIDSGDQFCHSVRSPLATKVQAERFPVLSIHATDESVTSPRCNSDASSYPNTTDGYNWVPDTRTTPRPQSHQPILPTHPRPLRGFVKENRLDGVMEIKKLSQGGRPSKGARHTFTVKLDLERAQKLRDVMEILSTDGVEYLSPIIAEHLDSIDLETLRNQETLPIAKAG